MITGKRPLDWFDYDPLFEITPEVWEACMPKLDSNLKDPILLTGTGGNIDQFKDIEKLFLNPEINLHTSN